MRGADRLCGNQASSDEMKCAERSPIFHNVWRWVVRSHHSNWPGRQTDASDRNAVCQRVQQHKMWWCATDWLEWVDKEAGWQASMEEWPLAMYCWTAIDGRRVVTLMMMAMQFCRRLIDVSKYCHATRRISTHHLTQHLPPHTHEVGGARVAWEQHEMWSRGCWVHREIVIYGLVSAVASAAAAAVSRAISSADEDDQERCRSGVFRPRRHYVAQGTARRGAPWRTDGRRRSVDASTPFNCLASRLVSSQLTEIRRKKAA